MADKVDPQKQCAAIANAEQRRSCEVLAAECNAQQDANASTFTLTGADDRKRTYRSLSACHKAAVALPKQLGPLPASRLSAPVKQPPPPVDYSSCKITGNAGTPKHEACKALVASCATSPTGPYTIHTNEGPVTAKDRQSCVNVATGLAENGYLPAAGTTQPPPPQTQPQPASPQSPGNGGAAANTAADTPVPANQQELAALTAGCRVAGPEGSQKNRSCKALVATCATSPNGPYTIKTNEGPVTAKDRQSCVSIATGLAENDYLPEGGLPQQAQTPSTPQLAQGSQQPAPTVPGGATLQPQPDAGPRQVKPFADVTNLRLRVTGETTTEQRLLLLFGAIQGVQVRFRYSLTRLQGDQFRMQYAIYVQGDPTPLGGEQTIDFFAPGNRMNLGFELSLWSEGNYKPIRGIRIVSLS